MKSEKKYVGCATLRFHRAFEYQTFEIELELELEPLELLEYHRDKHIYYLANMLDFNKNNEMKCNCI